MSDEVDNLLDGIATALRNKDMQAVVAMLHLLAVRDPAAAQAIIDSIGRSN